MNFFERMHSTQVSSRTAVICICLLLVLAAVAVLTARNIANCTAAVATGARQASAAENRSKGRIAGVHASEIKPAAKSKSKSRGGSLRPKTSPQEPRKKESGTAAANPYAIIAERNIFRPIGTSAEVPKASASGRGRREGQVKPMPIAPLPPADTGPPRGGARSRSGDADALKKNIAFTGLVETPEGIQAMIENLSSKEVRFLKSGESAFGFRLVSVTYEAAELEKDGERFRLAIGENKPEAEPAGAKPVSEPPRPPSGEPGKPGGPPSPKG